MPSLSRSLEQALHRAIKLASDRHHEYATLEHLLLSLLDDRDASAVMRACSVDMDALRTRLTEYVDNELASLVVKGSSEAQPTTSFQRVISCSCRKKAAWLSRSAKMATSTLAPVTSSRPEDCTCTTARWSRCTG